MALKHFNHEFRSISSGESTSYSTEEEAHLHCLLMETFLKSRAENFIDEIKELPIALHFLHDVILKCDPKSGPFGKTVELIEKMILTLKQKEHIVLSMPFLTVLTDVLLKCPTRTEHILKMIQDISFGINFRVCQPFLERLIKFCVDALCNEDTELDQKIKVVALSVLINLCNKNPISLSLLEDQTNLMTLQKKIPLETYGVLCQKHSTIVKLRSLDEKSLKHLVEFIYDLSEQKITKHLLQQYDFSLGIQSEMMTLENATETQIDAQINSFFEIIKIVLAVKNNSLNKLIITITNFAIKHLSRRDCCIQALEILTTIFNHDPKVSSHNFELDDIQDVLSTKISNRDMESSVRAPLFKLLNVLARDYKINLMKNHVMESTFAPLMKLDRSKYFKIPIGDITMYLECLALLSTLLQCQNFETKPNVFKDTNVQLLVAMSIKDGNADQCCLALSLMNRFSNYEISKIISDKEQIYDTNDPSFSHQNNSSATATDLRKEIESKRIKNVFFNIEKACLNEKIDVPTSDFIDLYTNKIATLEQEFKIFKKKYEDISKEVDVSKAQNEQIKNMSMKWLELAQNVQRSNETLLTENEKFNTIVASLKSKYKSAVNENDEAFKKLAQEKTLLSKKNKEMEVKLASLEDELKDTENMRQTILSLMSKRRKQT